MLRGEKFQGDPAVWSDGDMGSPLLKETGDDTLVYAIVLGQQDFKSVS